jgi:hypothetical protein
MVVHCPLVVRGFGGPTVPNLISNLAAGKPRAWIVAGAQETLTCRDFGEAVLHGAARTTLDSPRSNPSSMMGRSEAVV